MIGRSHIVGQPISKLLLQANATVTILHSRTKDMHAHLKEADVIVSAVGKPGLVTKMLKKVLSLLMSVILLMKTVNLREMSTMKL